MNDAVYRKVNEEFTKITTKYKGKRRRLCPGSSVGKSGPLLRDRSAVRIGSGALINLKFSVQCNIKIYFGVGDRGTSPQGDIPEK